VLCSDTADWLLPEAAITGDVGSHELAARLGTCRSLLWARQLQHWSTCPRRKFAWRSFLGGNGRLHRDGRWRTAPVSPAIAL